MSVRKQLGRKRRAPSSTMGRNAFVCFVTRLGHCWVTNSSWLVTKQHSVSGTLHMTCTVQEPWSKCAGGIPCTEDTASCSPMGICPVFPRSSIFPCFLAWRVFSSSKRAQSSQPNVSIRHFCSDGAKFFKIFDFGRKESAQGPLHYILESPMELSSLRW